MRAFIYTDSDGQIHFTTDCLPIMEKTKSYIEKEIKSEAWKENWLNARDYIFMLLDLEEAIIAAKKINEKKEEAEAEETDDSL